MNFEYLSESEVEPVQEIALLGMGSLATMKLGDADGEYQPPADELVLDLEAFLLDAVNDPQRDPDDPIVPNMMSKLFGFSFVWACGYRWAKNPWGSAYAADVVVSPDERYYLCPLDVILRFMDGGEYGLSQLLIDAYNSDLPDGDPPIQIPVED